MRLAGFILSGFVVAIGAVSAGAADATSSVSPPYYQVKYEASSDPGELRLGVTYCLWVPEGVKRLRGVIVHQHGCGDGARKSGAWAAYDLHWQALARKWDCALLGPSYQQRDEDNCTWWCDPRNGSEKTFLKALADLGASSGHPELAQVPWVLWGHSGGANWVGTMLLLHPERVVAVWLRSGSPKLFSADAKGGLPELPASALNVPLMFNLGVKEQEGRFANLWKSTLAFFNSARAAGALAGVAIDPRTDHECGDSRYLAIPWFDACLKERLPLQPGGPLRVVSAREFWLAPLFGTNAQPAAVYRGDLTNSVWLPNGAVSKAWMEYVTTGVTSDATPPPTPKNVQMTAAGELTWEADVDFESGLSAFVIERDGDEIARLPEKAPAQVARPRFQGASYHDTPVAPLPLIRYRDTTASPGAKHIYSVRAVNGVGLKSAPTGLPAQP